MEEFEQLIANFKNKQLFHCSQASKVCRLENQHQHACNVLNIKDGGDIMFNLPHHDNSGISCQCDSEFRIGPHHRRFLFEKLPVKCDQLFNRSGQLETALGDKGIFDHAADGVRRSDDGLFSIENSNRQVYSNTTDMPQLLSTYHLEINPPANFFGTKLQTTIQWKQRTYVFAGLLFLTKRQLNSSSKHLYITVYNSLYSLHLVEQSQPRIQINQNESKILRLLTKYFIQCLLELYDFYEFIENNLFSTEQEVFVIPQFLHQQDGHSLDISSICRCLFDQFKRVNDFVQIGEIVCAPAKRPSCFRVDGSEQETIMHMAKKSTKRESSDKNQSRKNSLTDNFCSRRSLPVFINFCNNDNDIYHTGLYSDILQLYLLCPAVINHILYDHSLSHLEQRINYKFVNRNLLHAALMHSSGLVVDSNNMDQIYTSLNNIRSSNFNLANSQFNPSITLQYSACELNYERLEFLGDAILEFLIVLRLSTHFNHLSEGQLSIYRAELVSNRFISWIALNRLQLHMFFRISHIYSDQISKMLSNCFESLLAAMFIDSCGHDLDVIDNLVCSCFFPNTPLPPLSQCTLFNHDDCPLYDPLSYPVIRDIEVLERQLGLTIRSKDLLVKVFCRNNGIGRNILTRGSNQQLEWIGDSVMKFVVSHLLFLQFPKCDEGKLSALRARLVSKHRQCKLYKELGLEPFLHNVQSYCFDKNSTALRISQNKIKERADILEALLAVIYIECGINPIYIILKAICKNEYL
ncbi:hypothetical protein GJ496_001564 [Pomphorhynchus laevis]|nr:hypothetical protein GJ496_001564 [Pomphorhynchus laevis]